MKPWHFWVSIAAIIVFTLLLAQDSLARLAWQKYGRPEIALWLVRHDADFALLLGNYYFGATIGKSEYDLEKAEKAFRKAITADPEILWGHYQLARIIFVKGDYNAALEEINKELEANPENLRALYVRGLIYGYRNKAGDLEKAEEEIKGLKKLVEEEIKGIKDVSKEKAKLQAAAITLKYNRKAQDFRDKVVSQQEEVEKKFEILEK